MADTWADQHGLRKRLDGLPLILCGPILGRTEPGSVTVWVALKAQMTVTLRVYTRFDPDAQGQLTERAIGTRRAVGLGESLHIVAVTATPTDEPLVAGQLYFYDLFFSANPAAVPVPETAEALRTPGIAEPLTGPTLDDLEPSNLSYAHEPRLPSFSLPPNELNKLRLINGSCRKPHGGDDADTFPGLDDMLAVDWPVAGERPHQLVLTGDQIYADGIPPVTLFMVMDADRALLGWDKPEPLPGVKPGDDLRPGARKHVVKEIAGLTTGGYESHPLRLAEYLGIYLLAWSDVLWPEQLPQLQDLLETLTVSGLPRPPSGPPSPALPQDVRDYISAGFEPTQLKLEAFRKTLKRARRALANVPTYMMLDDHDVTDDWNMYRDWANRVYSKELGRRVIQNGSTAYALCQAWGSVPDRFTDNAPGGALLQAVQAWMAKAGTDAAAHAEIARRVAIPPVTSAPDGTITGGLFATVEDGEALERPPGALDWHYTVPGPKHEVLALDSRTRRSFPAGKLDSPAQIGSAALRDQIDVGQGSSDAVTLVIAPTNLLTVPFFYGSRFYGSSPTISLQLIILAALRDVVFEARQLWRRLWGDEVAYEPDLSDSWSPQSAAFEAVISRLARMASASDSSRRTHVVVLSGDVHFSWAGRMRYWAERPFQEEEPGPPQPIDAIFAFLTSSAFKADSNIISRLVHRYGYVPVVDEFPTPARWFGWRKPITVSGGAGGVTDSDVGQLADWLLFRPALLRRTPAMLATGEEPLLTSAPQTPDWRYRIDFMLGEMSNRAQAALAELATPPPDDRDEWLKVFREALRRHRDYAHKWGDGLEMVGKNNFAVLRFHWEGDTKLAAGISESETSLRLADSTGFPDAPFRMIIGAETLEVGAIDRVTHVCSELKRGAFETTAQAHVTGAGVRTAKAVVQTHWWRLTDELGLLPLTTYIVSLEPEDARYPRPKLPGEADA